MDNTESREKANVTSFQGGAATAARMKKETAEVADRTRNAAADVVEAAATQLDAQNERADSKLERAAVALHQKREKLHEAAESAADKLHSTAGYLRERDASAMTEDLRELVRRHPGASLVAAAAAGFGLARLFRRK